MNFSVRFVSVRNHRKKISKRFFKLKQVTNSRSIMHENGISKIIVDTAFKIHTQLGPGLLESVYEEILHHELINLGLHVQRQKGIPVIWDNLKMEMGFRAYLIVENKVIIEIKSVEILAPVHPKQLLTYLRLTNMKLGLLINFNEPIIKNGIKRIVNNL